MVNGSQRFDSLVEELLLWLCLYLLQKTASKTTLATTTICC